MTDLKQVLKAMVYNFVTITLYSIVFYIAWMMDDVKWSAAVTLGLFASMIYWGILNIVTEIRKLAPQEVDNHE
jgi:hypothetical protein